MYDKNMHEMYKREIFMNDLFVYNLCYGIMLFVCIVWCIEVVTGKSPGWWQEHGPLDRELIDYGRFHR